MRKEGQLGASPCSGVEFWESNPVSGVFLRVYMLIQGGCISLNSPDF